MKHKTGANVAGDSPFKSPSRAASEHQVGRLSDVPDWTGANQVLCSVCGKKTTRVCLKCSTGGCVFGLCEQNKFNCSKMHRTDPENPKHPMRVSVGKYGKRQKRTSPPAAAPGPTPAPAKRTRGGATTDFDRREFAFQREAVEED